MTTVFLALGFALTLAGGLAFAHLRRSSPWPFFLELASAVLYLLAFIALARGL